MLSPISEAKYDSDVGPGHVTGETRSDLEGTSTSIPELAEGQFQQNEEFRSPDKRQIMMLASPDVSMLAIYDEHSPPPVVENRDDDVRHRITPDEMQSNLQSLLETSMPKF